MPPLHQSILAAEGSLVPTDAEIPRVNQWKITSGHFTSAEDPNHPRPKVSPWQGWESGDLYTKPVVNADGGIDIAFGPNEPKKNGNWIKTVPGRGFFPMFRFYGPAEAFFDKTWQLEDVVAVR